MKNTIKIPEEEMRDMDFYDLEQVKEWATKHDCHAVTYILPREDKFYKFTVEFSYNNGIQVYGDTEAVEVEPYEKVIKSWKVVES